MKRLFLFAAVSFICLSAHAQTVRLDSLIHYRDSLFAEPSEKHVYQYNGDGNHTKTTTWRTVFDGGVEDFRVTQIDSFDYNEEGLVESISTFGILNGAYYEAGRIFLDYDINGNNTAYIILGKSDMGNWIALWEWQNIYVNNKITESSFYIRNHVTGEKEISDTNEFLYDPVSGLLSEDISYSYDNPDGEKMPVSRHVFFYDGNGYWQKRESFRYDEPSMSFYLASIRYYEKDMYGNDLESFGVRVDSTGMETNSSRTIHEFDTNVERSAASLPVNVTIQLEKDRHIILNSEHASWEDDQWIINRISEFHYSGVTDTQDPLAAHELNVYPNPTSSKIYFGDGNLFSNTNKEIQIMRLDGQLIFNGKVNYNSIDVESLPAGLYNVQMLNNGLRFSGKFIKN